MESADNSPRAGIWIVMPAYNEAKRIAVPLGDVLTHFPNVVVVDDGSYDQTSDVALSTGCWVLRHVLNRGQGAALQTGIDFALSQGAEIIVTFDADGQHDVADIDRLIAPVHHGDADVVLGSRFLGSAVDMPLSRWLVLKGGVLFTRIFSWIEVSDTHNGLRAFSRHAAQALRITQDRMAHASQILDEIRRLGLRYCEVPVTIRYTADSLSKGQSSWDAAKIVGQLFIGRMMR
ncbi:MAG: glycosyltransferase family 2 protein [Gemmataceae bacterium]